MRAYHVHILASRSGVLYVGVTNDLMRRLEQHRHADVPSFTKRYKATRLVYFESTNDVYAVITREKQIKGWSRAKKVALIESVNAGWLDLVP